jgi:hypothetical protein
MLAPEILSIFDPAQGKSVVHALSLHVTSMKRGFRMSHTPHELHDEFPEAAQKIHDLKLGNSHFASLADRYHLLNREIHRIDAGIEPASDDRTEALKKDRLALLDEVTKMLGDGQAAAS